MIIRYFLRGVSFLYSAFCPGCYYARGLLDNFLLSLILKWKIVPAVFNTLKYPLSPTILRHQLPKLILKNTKIVSNFDNVFGIIAEN